MKNPRYYGKKDLDTFDRFNKELIGDLNNANSGIIDQTVIVYKISNNTETNMYGETSDGKVFKPGVEMPVWLKMKIWNLIQMNLDQI